MSAVFRHREQCDSCGMRGLTEIRVVDWTKRECLTIEESRQLLWQGQRGELIFVPLQQAHLLPATHKGLKSAEDSVLTSPHA